MSSYSLVIHGGAGSIKVTPEEFAAYKTSLLKVIKSGETLLNNGKSALSVVEHCVSLLENDPLYNAGKGSVFNAIEEIECDASIMDGSNLKAGSCAAVHGIKNPIRLANKILSKSEHVMLIGDGAQEFAKNFQEIETEDPQYFFTEKRYNQLVEARKQGKTVLDHTDLQENKYGTVGAVAFDQKGNIAAATSTGGITNKKWGRVGDSPIIGAGTYADNKTCGVSCTGYGEQFIRTSLAKTISDIIWLKEVDAATANKLAMQYLQEKVNGLGGAIVIDYQGSISTNFTTSGMLQAAVISGQSAIFSLSERFNLKHS